MRFVPVLTLLPLALAACSGGDAGNTTTAAAAPVAATAAPAGKNWIETVAKTEDGYVMGNPDAPIKLVEYGSRTCPTCGQFGRDAMQPLEKNYVASGKVSYEYREFLVHGPPDLPAALLGRCVEPTAFFPLLEQMYINQAQFETKLMDQAAGTALQAKLANASGPQIAAAWGDYMGFVDFVKQRGVPEAKARACLADAKEIDKLTTIMQDATTNKKVTGTPAFFINGTMYDGAPTWQGVEQALKAAGA